MGRQQDLDRLALGRSAFQDAPPAEEGVGQGLAPSDASPAGQRIGGENSAQQYDDKGRPINPATEARNQSMRNAQNAVLALVGVVESKENSDRELAKQQSQALEAREQMLQLEQASADRLDLIATVLHVAFAWFPEVSVSRVQAGLYARSRSWGDIVSTQFDVVKTGDIRGLFDTFFAGLPTTIIHRYLSRLLNEIARSVIGRLQARLARARFKQKALGRVNRVLVFSFHALVVMIDVALLPIQYYAIVKGLGLSPARPLLPSWQELLPRTNDSVHSLLWQPVVQTPGLGRMCSPAVLILLQNQLRPVLSSFSHAYLFRDRLLEWFGWKEEDKAGNRQSALAPRSLEADKRLWAAHRSTTLTYLPVQYLAERVDELLARVVMLPWRSMVVRVITRSFLSSTLSRTPLAIASTPYVYSPFGGGPLRLLRNLGVSSAARDEVAGYTNQLGLSLALNCTVEIGLFFIVYKLTRWRNARISDEITLRGTKIGEDP